MYMQDWERAKFSTYVASIYNPYMCSRDFLTNHIQSWEALRRKIQNVSGLIIQWKHRNLFDNVIDAYSY